MSSPLLFLKRSLRKDLSTCSTKVYRPTNSLSYLPGMVTVTSAKAVRGATAPAAGRLHPVEVLRGQFEVDLPDLRQAEDALVGHSLGSRLLLVRLALGLLLGPQQGHQRRGNERQQDQTGEDASFHRIAENVR